MLKSDWYAMHFFCSIPHILFLEVEKKLIPIYLRPATWIPSFPTKCQGRHTLIILLHVHDANIFASKLPYLFM